MSLYLGIDFGTSGARAVVIDADGTSQVEAQCSFEAVSGKQAVRRTPTAVAWEKALFSLLEKIPGELREIKAIAINGTSSTVLLCDDAGKPLDEPILYNDARGEAVLDQVKAIAPPNHPVISATSSLAKLLWWQEISPHLPYKSGEKRIGYFLHQADWLSFLLHGRLGISDYHNALKLGYDVENLRYPDWLQQQAFSPLLPQVLPPGTPVGEVTKEISDRFRLPQDCIVCTGTTDSIAAFMASGAKTPGEAVTSLGSTLVLKLLSQTRVDDPEFGIYSHRLGDLWLVGGASNTGGAVLRHFFTDAELERLSNQIDVQKESRLDYYPLLGKGDRFPINDPNLPPRLEPRPDNPVEFLHGLLESIARIEARGYQLLQQLGATPLNRVYTAGGGAKNTTWTAIRRHHLGVETLQSVHTEAAYGTALLALKGLQ
ncbi:MAG: FGGY-family carbohydrate kinase [Kastovskya adunca ATA6-11-RM4]|jgi:sugar (pentulose or hexulose) kinase|nr:FGGY-family carbohydrate kinase [Kastovskya adunca ATA6-11-RM4]